MADAHPLRLMVRGPDAPEQEASFSGEVVRVGRAADNDLPLESTYVSRLHARFERGSAGWEIVDEGSKNGVYLNGQKLEGRGPVRAGDTVRIGDFSLLVAAEPAPPPAPEPPAFDEERTVLQPVRPQQVMPTDSQGSDQPQREPAITASRTAKRITVPAQQEPEAAAVAAPAPVATPAPVEPVAAAGEPVPAMAPAGMAAAETSTVDPGNLTERERRLFRALTESMAELSTPDLVATVWGAGEGDSAMLDRLVVRLNRSLVPGNMRVAHTNRGGYRMAHG